MGRQRTDLTSTLPNNEDGVENNPDLYIDTTQDAPDPGRHSPSGESECTAIGGFSHYKLYDHAQNLIHHHHNSSHHDGGSGGGNNGGGLPHYGMISQHLPYHNHLRPEDLSLMPPSNDTGGATTSSGALHHHSVSHLRSAGYSQDSYYASTNNNNNNNGTNHVDETLSRHQSAIDNQNQNQHGLQQLTCLPVVKYEPVQQSQDSSESSPVSVDAHIEKSVFTIEHVNCVCRVLVQEKNYFQLSKFLTRLPKEMLKASDEVVRAQAVVAYQSGDFPLLYALLQSRIFPPEYHTQLQTLWYNAHYTEAEKTRGRKLGAVDKYRIRKKHPRPKNIWDGEETIYTFKERSRSALKECFRRTRYPNPDEKKQLSMLTNLTITQVGNWFKNKRQRDRTSQARDPGSDGLVITPVSSNGSSHPAHLPYSFHQNDRKSPIYSSKPPRLENGQLVFSNGRKRLANLDLYEELKSARMIDGETYSPPLGSKRSRAGTTSGPEDPHPYYSNLVNKLPQRSQISAEKDPLTGFPHEGKLNKRGGNNNSGAEYYNNSRNSNLGKKSGKQQRTLTPNPNQFDPSPMGGLGHHPPPGSPIMRLVNSSVSSSTGSSSLTNGFGSQHYNTSAGGIDRSPNITSPASPADMIMHHGGYSHGCNAVGDSVIQHLQAGGHYIQNPAQFSTFSTTGTPFDSILPPAFQSYSCHASATLSHA